MLSTTPGWRHTPRNLRPITNSKIWLKSNIRKWSNWKTNKEKRQTLRTRNNWRSMLWRRSSLRPNKKHLRRRGKLPTRKSGRTTSQPCRQLKQCAKKELHLSCNSFACLKSRRRKATPLFPKLTPSLTELTHWPPSSANLSPIIPSSSTTQTSLTIE